jgi:hypothetical protein
MPIEISVRADFKSVTKGLSDLAYKQLPFAQAQAVTDLARTVQTAEVEQIEKTFPTATPFTLKSVGVIPARKGNPVATVFMKDIAAQYLEPFEEGGKHFLGNKKAILDPINQQTNQYGNLPMATIAKLKGRPDVFIGPVKTKAGKVYGVWQRPYQKGKGRRTKRSNTTDHLKLLIRFEPPQTVNQHLDWEETAKATVAANWRKDFDDAMTRALATAK